MLMPMLCNVLENYAVGPIGRQIL